MTSIPSNLARLLAGGCALALLTLTACGGSDDGAGGGAPTSGATTDGRGPTTAAGATTGASAAADDDGDASDGGGGEEDGGTDEPAYWLSPLDEFLGFGTEPSEEEQAEWDQQQRQVEQLIAACMNAQGFEYTPIDPSSVPSGSGPWDLPPDEFARQYGYGITTIEREEFTSGDPNAAVVEAMSVPEKQAYYQALYGDMIAIDENGAIDKRMPSAEAATEPETESCSAQASTEVYGEGTEVTRADESDPFAALNQEMGALYERVEGDQRVVDARTAWSGCMADAGYPGLVDIYDASAEVSERATALMGESMDPAAADPAALEELRAYEIGVATADLDCRVDYDAVRREVQTELEHAFIDEHRAELEQYRDAIAAGNVGVG